MTRPARQIRFEADPEAWIAPDAALCDACREEVLSPFDGRFRYPFTSCAHCGPRFGIAAGAGYGRAQTTMAAFAPCEACLAEYHDPGNRRFHAETIACHSCGPRASLVRFDGRAISFDQHSMLDDVDAAGGLIQKGEIVAIKGPGGWQLACDATNESAVRRLRERKGVEARPFALMARDIDVVGRYCLVSETEEAVLRGPGAPVVLLRARNAGGLPTVVAPRLKTLGFMLPPTPWHMLMLRRMVRPVVVTSGNPAGEAQTADDAQAAVLLSPITPFALTHDCGIAQRLDMSVVQEVAGEIRVKRRAWGYAPAPRALPPGFHGAPDVLAFGGSGRAAACLVKDGAAFLLSPGGDLARPASAGEYGRTIGAFSRLLDHRPEVLASELHATGLAARLAADHSQREGLPLIRVQHHHAHIAACLTDNARPLDAPPVLGIVLDGAAPGGDGADWCGEFLLADYHSWQRLGCLKPIAMPSGAGLDQPWRHLAAHIAVQMGWAEFSVNFADLELHAFLDSAPGAAFRAALKGAPIAALSSSCAGLFEAVAAALGICRDSQSYDGQAMAELEAIADAATLYAPGEDRYPIAIPRLPGVGIPYIEPLGLWRALFGDLVLKTPAPVIAARFHNWLAESVVTLAVKLARRDGGEPPRFDSIALSGACFDNRILFEAVARGLEHKGFHLLTHRQIPADDGGLALGQAAISAAALIRAKTQSQGNTSCVSEFPAAS